MPFGLADFVEIMQDGSIHTGQWYDYLNLGLKLTPMAGSDYPYIDQPGSVRAYALVEGGYSPAAWFDAVKKGRVFVTNGPFINFTINKQTVGSTLQLDNGEKISVSATVNLNPHYDKLDRVELVRQGEVVQRVVASNGQQELRLKYDAIASQGQWFAIRAYGKNNALAHSAPIYIHVGNDSHRAQTKSAAIAKKLIAQLKEMKQQPDTNLELEFWQVETGFEQTWEQQKERLFKRIDKAIAWYQKNYL